MYSLLDSVSFIA